MPRKKRDDGVPKSFQLGGHTVKVLTIPLKKWPHGENVLAMWMPSELKIELRGDLEGSHRQAVWLHEVTHAVFDMACYHELSENEELVERVATFLHQILTTMK